VQHLEAAPQPAEDSAEKAQGRIRAAESINADEHKIHHGRLHLVGLLPTVAATLVFEQGVGRHGPPDTPRYSPVALPPLREHP